MEVIIILRMRPGHEEEVCIPASPVETVAEIKACVEKLREGADASRQLVVYNKTLLKDSSTLSELQITAGAKINISLRPAASPAQAASAPAIIAPQLAPPRQSARYPPPPPPLVAQPISEVPAEVASSEPPLAAQSRLHLPSTNVTSPVSAPLGIIPTNTVDAIESSKTEEESASSAIFAFCPLATTVQQLTAAFLAKYQFCPTDIQLQTKGNTNTCKATIPKVNAASVVGTVMVIGSDRVTWQTFGDKSGKSKNTQAESKQVRSEKKNDLEDVPEGPNVWQQHHRVVVSEVEGMLSQDVCSMIQTVSKIVCQVVEMTDGKATCEVDSEEQVKLLCGTFMYAGKKYKIKRLKPQTSTAFEVHVAEQDSPNKFTLSETTLRSMIVTVCQVTPIEVIMFPKWAKVGLKTKEDMDKLLAAASPMWAGVKLVLQPCHEPGAKKKRSLNPLTNPVRIDQPTSVPIALKSLPVLEYLKQIVAPQLKPVRCLPLRAQDSPALQVMGPGEAVAAAVKRLKEVEATILSDNVILPRSLYDLLRATQKFEQLMQKKVVCSLEDVNENNAPDIKSDDSDALSVFSDGHEKEEEKEKEKEQSVLVSVFICALDSKVIQDLKKKFEELRTTFVCKRIPLQKKQVACFNQRPKTSRENTHGGVVLTKISTQTPKGAVAAVLSSMLPCKVALDMVRLNNLKNEITVDRLPPNARNMLISKGFVVVNGQNLKVKQRKDVRALNQKAIETKNASCIRVNHADLTLDICAYDSASVEATQAAVAREITPATSRLDVDASQAKFLHKHHSQVVALKNLHGMSKLEYQDSKKPCYFIEGAFSDAVFAARSELEKLATVFTSKSFNIENLAPWLLRATEVAWEKAHDEVVISLSSDRKELQLVSSDEISLVAAELEMQTILKNIEDATKKFDLTGHQPRILIEKLRSNPEFQRTWHVGVSVDSKVNNVTLIGDCPDTTQAAWEALNGFLDGTRMASRELPLPTNVVLNLFTLKARPPVTHPLNMTSLLKKIVMAQNKRVYFLCETGDVENKQERGGSALSSVKWIFKGPEKAVAEAMEEAQAKITKLEQDVGQVVVDIDAWKADALMLNNRARIRKVCNATSTYIDMEGMDRRVLLAIQTGNGHKLQIVRGDIAVLPADAIVNAANNQLSHGSGVALALAQAAGSAMTDASAQSVASRGPVPTGEARVTAAGNLPCKLLIHAVGPVWGNNEGESGLLAGAVFSALELANASLCTSINLPALSCGAFGCPESKGAEIIVGAIRNWCASNTTQLKEINIVISDRKTCEAFVATVNHVVNVLDAKQAEEEDSALRNSLFKPSTACQWQWCWQMMPDDPQCRSGQAAPHTWVPYDYDQNQALETHYQQALQDDNKQPAPIVGDQLGMKNGWSYSVRFDLANDQHEQKNTTTNRVRPVQRTKATQPAPLAPAVRKDVGGQLSRLTAVASGSKRFTISGLRTHLAEAEKLLKEASEKILGERSLTLKVEIPQEALQGVQALAAQNDFRVTFATGSGQTTLTAQGFIDNADSVFAKIQQYLLELQMTDKPRFEFPKEWTPAQSSNLQLIDLDSTSAEFKNIQTRMLHGTDGVGGVPNVVVERIQRVQNVGLWNAYSLQKEGLKKKLQSGFRELPLFHGTSSTDPRLVYNGETGFAMQFCDRGMWGRGTYFAANFSYSHAGYRYRLPSQEGKSQVFLANVLVGASFETASDPNIKMPPPNPTLVSKLFEVERYDSVTGTTGGSRVYIVYENSRAYPSYLITYSS